MDEVSIKNYLRERKLKATSIRVDLLMLMSQSDSALPYSEIQKHLKDFDRVTLYRTINVLIDSGIVHKASTSGEEIYYALCTRQCSRSCHKHEHIHFRCTECKEVSCLHVDQALKVSIPDYSIQEVSVEVKGICKKCLEN